MRSNEDFISELKATYEGEPWFGESFQTKVNSITEEQALKQPKTGEHSIAQVVSHMEFWRRAVLAKIRGENVAEFTGDNPENWPSAESMKKKGWESIRTSFSATHAALIASLGQSDSLPLNLAGELAGTMQHDVYHIGQIGFIKKLV